MCCWNTIGDAFPEQIDDPIANTIPDPGKNAEQIVVDEETKRIVREILESLPERDQRILREIFLEERIRTKFARTMALAGVTCGFWCCAQKISFGRKCAKTRRDLKVRPPTKVNRFVTFRTAASLC